jgi:ethanolaminephosphotransferase
LNGVLICPRSSSIDLSQAYNGISSYDVRLVSLLTYLSNFAGPVFWSLATLSLLRLHPISSSHHIPTCTSHFLYTTAFHCLSLLTLAISATHFRRHLFTWTVFSPALLYKGVWSVLVHWFSGIMLASLQ